MRLKKVLILILCVGFCAAWATSAVMAEGGEEEMCVPLGVIDLEAPEGVESRRSAVEFPHGQHFAYACQECHHMWEGDEPIRGCMTAGCHDLVERPADKADKYLYFKEAYHSACIGCHKAIKVKNKKAEQSLGTKAQLHPVGPTSCGQCHPKE